MNPLLGQIQPFPFYFAPQGWLPCDGRLIPITQNTALFSLISNSYGGDGKTTFALPNIPPMGPQGPNYCIAVAGIFPKQSA